MTSPLVSTDWLAARLTAPDIVIVDASWYLPMQNRDAQAEYLAAHIPGAVRFDIDAISDRTSSLPHMMPRPEEFAAAVGKLGIGDGMKIVIYDGAGLFSAPRVWWMFRTFGATDVAILDGGFPKWQAEGRPVEDGAVSRAPRSFTARLNHGAVADRTDVERALGDGVTQVIDMRSAGRFTGAEPEFRPGLPSGHMPGALNVPSSELIADGRLKPAGELLALLKDRNIDPDAPILTTCGSGVSAAIMTLALEVLGKPAKALYDGSWTEWASQPDAKIFNISSPYRTKS
jgi:thiosulfate/3-mercaptopyruvate sulfurtransferase